MANITPPAGPVAHDGGIVAGRGTRAFEINAETYLPSGFGGGLNNSLPVACNNFVFLKVPADLTAMGGGWGDEFGVYVPCYFPNPDDGLFNVAFDITHDTNDRW